MQNWNWHSSWTIQKLFWLRMHKMWTPTLSSSELVVNCINEKGLICLNTLESKVAMFHICIARLLFHPDNWGHMHKQVIYKFMSPGKCCAIAACNLCLDNQNKLGYYCVILYIMYLYMHCLWCVCLLLMCVDCCLWLFLQYEGLCTFLVLSKLVNYFILMMHFISILLLSRENWIIDW